MTDQTETKTCNCNATRPEWLSRYAEQYEAKRRAMSNTTRREIEKIQDELEKLVDYMDIKDFETEWALNILFMTDNLLSIGRCWPEASDA